MMNADVVVNVIVWIVCGVPPVLLFLSLIALSLPLIVRFLAEAILMVEDLVDDLKKALREKKDG